MDRPAFLIQIYLNEPRFNERKEKFPRFAVAFMSYTVYTIEALAIVGPENIGENMQRTLIAQMVHEIR